MRDVKTITTLTCDRCKEVVTELKPLYTFTGKHTFRDDGYSPIDLCIPCYERFEKFIANPTVLYQNVEIDDPQFPGRKAITTVKV